MMQSDKPPYPIWGRRDVLVGAAAAGLSNVSGVVSQDFLSISSQIDIVEAKAKHGEIYETVPLRQENINIAAIQSAVGTIEENNLRRGIKQNVLMMSECIDRVQSHFRPADLICFHDLSLQGLARGDFRQLRRMAVEMPGEEIEVLTKKAREYSCYLKFGGYATDSDWPGHVLFITALVGPDGRLIAKDWKLRHSQANRLKGEQLTTTISDVVEEYVEMYGTDSVFRVHRTNIGNLAMASVQGMPEVFRSMALRGAELFLRTAQGGFHSWDIRASAGHNYCYSIVVANCEPNNLERNSFYAATWDGGTAIYGPNGDTIAECSPKWEQTVVASVPIASFRKRRLTPPTNTNISIFV